MVNITDNSKALFVKYWKEANDWDGQPIVDGTKAERGNLTQLKLAGLIETVEDTCESLTWVQFTDMGKTYAHAALGFKVEGWEAYH